MFIHLPRVLGSDDVAALLTELDKGPFVDGRETADHEAALVKRNLELSTSSPLRKVLSERITDVLLKN